MYQTFSGSSRRPRQVNLSGKKANPFASGPQGGPNAALANAQLERQQRQRQREELAAAKNIQRVWRGHSSRKTSRQAQRAEWDQRYGQGEAGSFDSEEQAWVCARSVLGFARASDGSDRTRLVWFLSRIERTVNADGLWRSSRWTSIYTRLERVCLQTLAKHGENGLTGDQEAFILKYTEAFALALGPHFSRVAHEYFRAMSNVYHRLPSQRRRIADSISLPLSTWASDDVVYKAFATELLTRPQDQDLLSATTRSLKANTLVAAVQDTPLEKLGFREALWLLGQFIFLVRSEAGSGTGSAANSTEYTHVVGHLLAQVADGIDSERDSIDLPNGQYDSEHLSGDRAQKVRLNTFLKDSLSSLIDQNTIRRVLSGYTASGGGRSTELATYVLTLLRVFYSHADDIRMWLYLGPPGQQTQAQDVSPIGFFWREARKSSVVQSIMRDTRSATRLIVNKATTSQWQPPNGIKSTYHVADEWKVVLIFFELYTFVLKLMDDEEFLGHLIHDAHTRSNPLSIPEVADLVVFLKHLGFAMYYYSQQISEGTGTQEPLNKQSLLRHFGGGRNSSQEEVIKTEPSQPVTVAGLPGVSIEYVQGLVTGLVRSIYERDSRRKFLPKGHWLMTSEFDMSNFISDVVAEEESRHQIQDMEDEDGTISEEEADIGALSNMNSNLRRIEAAERTQRALRRASRKRYLESVAPRLEILQHMPFLIPFDTRVQIFREFVRLDQVKRRYGQVDPDIWRQSLVMRHEREHAERELNKHHARVRRKHEFEDAMDSFFELGQDLKEPIQITFVDEFDMVEAGIDGGGVTKEFLTSAIAQAFQPDFGLFEANKQHLLYPKPTAVDELKETFRLLKMPMNSEIYTANMGHLLQRFEFAGRIIGKCLYEGILVDVSFAGFFLVKWALAGASGMNSLDSGYRANINDLRDLDEELYQGLLSLKNYQGDVQDLALTFSVNDEVPIGDGRVKTIERELIPGGADTPVTNENRLVYISRVARYRLQAQAAQQTNAFLRGLSSIIQPSWLSMFNQSELQNLVGGAASAIDIEDLRRNSIYGGVYVIGDDGQEHPSVQLFWKAMHEMKDEDKGKVLKFVTSTPRAPLLGFGSLMPKFSIRDSGDDESRFPTTSTCINLLKLPRYKTKQTLKDKLLYAINSGAGFDLS